MTTVPTIREFETGATRSPLGEKLCYSGFMSPIAQKRFAEYMHINRKQSDGQLREPDNWKKGIPIKSYMDSMSRHYQDVWLHMDGHSGEATEDMETALCGLFFNVQGLLHEIVKARL